MFLPIRHRDGKRAGFLKPNPPDFAQLGLDPNLIVLLGKSTELHKSQSMFE